MCHIIRSKRFFFKIPITRPKQCSSTSEFILVSLLKDLLPHKDARVSVFVIRIMNRQKPFKKGRILGNFIDNLPIRIVLALPNLALLKVANITDT